MHPFLDLNADGPDDPYPASIGLFCDTCRTETVGDYVVTDRMTKTERYALVRKHLNENEGWHCTDDSDMCPECFANDRGTLSAHLDNVTRLRFPYVDTDAEYRDIVVDRSRPGADTWTVSDGSWSWWRDTTKEGDRIDPAVSRGSFTPSRHQATKLPLNEAVPLAKEVADRRRAVWEDGIRAHDALLAKMRALLPPAYPETWSEEPLALDVRVFLTTNGRQPNITGQIDIYVWGEGGEEEQPVSGKWSLDRDELLAVFENAGWDAKPSRTGLVVVPPREES